MNETDFPGRLRALQLGAVGLGHFLVDFYMSLIPAILPFLAVRLHLSMTALGALVTAQAATASLLQPFFGHLADRRGHGVLLAATVAWTGVLICVVGSVESYPVIFGLTILSALGVAFYHPLGANFTSHLAGPRKAPAMSIYIVCGSIGFAICPLLAPPLVTWGGMPALWLLVIPAVIGVVALLPGGLPGMRIGDATAAALPRLRLDRAGGWLMVLTLIVVFRTWVQFALLGFVPLLFVERGYSMVTGGQILTVFLIAGALGILAAGFISRHMSHKSFLFWNVILLTAAMFGFLKTTGWTAWALLALVGALIQAPIPVTVLMAQELAPKRAGAAAGLIMGGAGGIGSLGTVITGAIGDHFGLTAALGSLVPVLACAVLLTAVYPRDETFRKPVETI